MSSWQLAALTAAGLLAGAAAVLLIVACVKARASVRRPGPEDQLDRPRVAACRRQVLKLSRQGLTNVQIARRLDLDVGTVELVLKLSRRQPSGT